MESIKFYRQLDRMDCGPTCLRIIAKYFGKEISADYLRDLCQVNKRGVSMLGIAEASEKIGLKALGVEITIETLIDKAPLPCILHWEQNHFVVLHDVKVPFAKRIFQRLKNILTFSSGRVSKESVKFLVADPAHGPMTFGYDDLKTKWLNRSLGGKDVGSALLLEPTIQFTDMDFAEGKELRLGQLVDYLFKYKSLMFQLGMSIFLGSALQLVFPFLTQSIVDIGVGTQNISFLYIILFAQMILLMSSASLGFIRSWILLHISVRLNLTILSEFLSKLMRLPISYFDVRHFGDIMQRITDHKRIESFLTGQALHILFSIVNLIMFGIMLAWYSLTIFGTAVFASLLYAGWITIFLKKRRSLDKQRFEVSAKSQSQIVQLIQGMQEIKLSGSEFRKRWEWERTQVKLFKWSVSNLTLSQIQQSGALFINNGKNIIITFLAAKSVIEGNLSLGGMVSVQYILGQFNAPIEQMIQFLHQWQDAKISLERLNEVHSRPDEENTSYRVYPFGTLGKIEIKNVSFTYPGVENAPALKDISFEIPSGQTTAIVGSSGSGKTTLLKLLLRIYEYQSGTIEVNDFRNNLQDNSPKNAGRTIRSISHKAWRKECGVVLQDGFIFSDSVARNIAVGDEIIDNDRLIEAARIANIHDFIESLPSGYHTKIGAEGNGISQGQKQRVLIARAVYKNPALLLFDEATNALDAKNELVIMNNLMSFFQGRTAVVVAHRLSTVRNADQIVVLERGQIVEIGNHDSLVRQNGRYLELISNQLELSKG